MAKNAKKELIKANFMYGSPNKDKYKMIAETQKLYLESINKFIGIFKDEPKCYLAIFNLDTKSSEVTKLEKKYRDSYLGSAFSQKASHVALDKLHSMFLMIKSKSYGSAKKRKSQIAPFIECTSLLVACLTNNCTREAIKDAIDREYQSIFKSHEKAKIKFREDNKLPENEVVYIDYPKKTAKLKYYQELKLMIDYLDDDALCFIESEVRFEFFDRLDNYKTPVVTFSPIPLDSRTCKWSDNNNTKFDYILEVTVAKGIDSNGRIAIPFKTSSHCKKRLRKFKNCQPSIYIDKLGRVKLSVPTKLPKTEAKKGKCVVIGTDLGIKKIFSLSDGKTFGTFSGLSGQYNEMVEKLLGNRSSLRNVMRQYQKELRKKTTSEERKAVLRTKIFNIAKSLQGTKRLTKARNRYNFATCKTISSAMKEFIAYLTSLQSKVLIVFESLDIRSFDSSKENNKASSMWARGQIIHRLKEKLDEVGIEYSFVDPAYTSQTCPVCSKIDKNSRDKEVFKCTCCGYTADADANAGVNIKNRYGDSEVNGVVEKYGWNNYFKHKHIKEIFEARHKNYLASIM